MYSKQQFVCGIILVFVTRCPFAICAPPYSQNVQATLTDLQSDGAKTKMDVLNPSQQSALSAEAGRFEINSMRLDSSPILGDDYDDMTFRDEHSWHALDTVNDNRRDSYETEENDHEVGIDADWVCWDMFDEHLGELPPDPPVKNITGIRFKCGDAGDGDGACVCIQCNETRTVAMCNRTGLPHIPRFSANLTIDYLMFFSNGLQLINDSSFFQYVPHVRRLDLDHNDIRNLPRDAFKLLTKLEYIRLSDNVYLDISQSQNTEAIFSLKTLRILDVGNTYFGADFPEDTFITYPMPRLERLYVVSSAMRFWNVRLFEPLTALRYITMMSNDMKSVNVTLLNSTNVSYLDLHANDMFDFPTTCHNGSSRSYFPNLDTLHLGENRLNSIPGRGDKDVCLPSLTNLTLNWNALRYLDTHMFSEAKFPALKILYLDRLDVMRLIAAYTFNNSRIQYLSMMYNNIDFTKSRKTKVNDSAFLGLTGLRILHLEHNYGLNDGRVAYLFRESIHMQELYLGNTFIDVITPDTFSLFLELELLSLYHNPISSLAPGSFDRLTKLKYLDLSSCWIVTLSEHHFSLDTRLRLDHLDLSDNNFRCDCDLMWLRDWMARDRRKFYSKNYGLYLCLTPPELSGDEISGYRLQEQSCLISETAASIIIAVVTLFVLVLTSVPCLYRYRWHIRLMLYEAFRGRNQRLLLPASCFKYDVFVSYAEEDLKWVKSNLLGQIENQIGLRLCLHQRDFIPGQNIVDNIFYSVEASRKLLMVFSRHFARSQWCQFELAMCLQHVIDNNDALLIVCVDDVTSVGSSDLTATMMAVLQTTTYIQWQRNPDAIRSFWCRLKLALCEILPSESEKKKNKLRRAKSVKRSDDKPIVISGGVTTTNTLTYCHSGHI